MQNKYFYLVFDKLTKLTKIGESQNPKIRFNDIKVSNQNVVLVYYSKKYTEKELHNEYASKRHSGEWFKLDLSDYLKIIGHKTGLPKSLYYRNGLQKFITEIDKSYKETINEEPKMIYYNTLYQVMTDGKSVWNDKDISKGFVPKDRAMIYFKIDGRLLSSKQVFNPRYLVWIKEETLPF